MNTHIKIAVVISVVGILTLIGTRVTLDVADNTLGTETTDAGKLKGRVRIGMDSWFGYFPLCSKVMKSNIRKDGYAFECVDDNADYKQRMEALDDGDLEFAVATVDANILNGHDFNYPGVIVAVIDESRGGDAIVAKKSKVPNVEALKNDKLQVAYTPSSPSHHFIKAIGTHFNIPHLLGKRGHVHTNGSKEALQLLKANKVDAAVVWQPEVAKALAIKGVHKVLGSEDTRKLIVDVLLANKKVVQDNPDVVQTVLATYFRTLKYYRDNPKILTSDAASFYKIKDKSIIKAMSKGVAFASLHENCSLWFGCQHVPGHTDIGLIDAINSATQILIDAGDFKDNPLPNEDPYRLISSSFIEQLDKIGVAGDVFGGALVAGQVNKAFTPLTTKEWDALREMGVLKNRNIEFRTSSSGLTIDGKTSIDSMMEHLKHYPNHRIVVKGHTGIRGDKNMNIQLSQRRADSVARYLKVAHTVDENRVRSIGYGSEQPLQKRPGESRRSYKDRLARVEIILATESY